MLDPSSLFARRLLLVTGKGGIGKSLVTAALGQLAAEQGKRVLLVESAAKGQLGPLFGVDDASHETREVAPGLRVVNLDPPDNFREYVVKHLGQKRLYETVFSNKVVSTFINTIPGLAELMMLGRLFYHVELAPPPRPDLVVFDGFASGHFLSLMTTPDAVLQSNLGGPLARETERVKAFLADQARCGVVYVTVPEELVVSETLDFLPQLASRSPAAVLGLIVNRCPLPVPADGAASPAHDYLAKRSADAARALTELEAGLAALPGPKLPLATLAEQGFIAEPLAPGFGSRLFAGGPPVSGGPVASLVGNSRVLVMLGAGGVGKTTSSIVMALLGAREGKRVALLSIDPAKRLAAALGIPLGNQLSPLALPAGLGLTGTVDAAMLDQKAVFDSMVRRYAPGEAVTQRILAHPVYKAASTNLSGPLEYMALAKLQDLADDPRYDLIVLDTPPDTHALDFLARPNVLAGFMENKVMSWLIKPFLVASRFGLGRVLSAGERLMGGVAKVAGVTALHSFADFLALMQEVIGGFHQSGERIVQLLHRPDTQFMLVTVPTLAAARSATNIAAQLQTMRYSLALLLFNRCLPSPVAADPALVAAAAPAYAALGLRAAGEAKVRAALPHSLAVGVDARPPLVLRLDERDRDIDGLADLLALADALASQG